MAATRPRIYSPCVADRYHAPGERMAEFASADGAVGGLICLWTDPETGALHLHLYRLDRKVVVHVEPLEDRTR